MNSALMKSTELKMLWKLVKSGETRPLSAADCALLLRIRFALQEYEKVLPPQNQLSAELDNRINFDTLPDR
jgi:hypothetical protein